MTASKAEGQPHSSQQDRRTAAMSNREPIELFLRIEGKRTRVHFRADAIIEYELTLSVGSRRKHQRAMALITYS